jgi:hypothetical protein
MKKLIVVAAVFLTMGVAKANAGVSFEISVGDRHHGGRGSSRPHAEYYHAPRHAPPRYIVRECCSYPRYNYGRPVHRHSHHYYGGHRGGHGRGH